MVFLLPKIVFEKYFAKLFFENNFLRFLVSFATKTSNIFVLRNGQVDDSIWEIAGYEAHGQGRSCIHQAFCKLKPTKRDDRLKTESEDRKA